MNASSATGRVLRSLRRSPGFVAIATLSMGIALGLSTSVFAVMDAMTHPDPPFRDVGQLYFVNFRIQLAAPPPAEEFTRNLLALDGVERSAPWRYSWDQMVITGGRVGRTSVGRAGPGFFDVLGVRPRLGRLFAPADHERGDVAIVTDMVWRRDYANRAKIGDATVQMGDRLYPVVGVLPSGADRSLWGDIYLAAVPTGEMFSLLVRLKPGVSGAQFQARLKEMNERLTKIYAGPKDRGIGAYIRTLRPDPLMVRDFHRAMVGAAVCILLNACANVAALMLARGMVKRRDYALRLALGAHPFEIGREVVAEVGILAILGCVAGAFVTAWFVGLIGGAMPPEMEWQGFVQPQWSWRVFALAGGAVLLSIAVAGGFPAWMAARTDPAGPLKEGAGGTTGRAGTRFRWLVMAELAIAMTLMMSTSLMMKSIRRMEAYEFGYANNRLLYAYVGAAWRQDSTTVEEEARLTQQALATIRAIPGVQAAIPGGMGSACGNGHPIVMGDRSVEGGASLNLLQGNFRGSGGCRAVGPGFFSTLGLQIVGGRDFVEGDAAPGATGAVILDEKTAKTLFPHESPVGRTVRFGNENSRQPWIPVIGVVKNHMLGFDPHPEMGVDSAATVYMTSAPQIQKNRKGQPLGSRSMTFLVRTGPDVDETSLRVVRALVPLTPGNGRASVQSMDQPYQEHRRSDPDVARCARGRVGPLVLAAGAHSAMDL